MSHASIAGRGLIGSQLIGVTRGLHHLHENDIVHKKLKDVGSVHYSRSFPPTDQTPLQTNVLIDETGSPRLRICNARGQMARYWAPEHYSCQPDAERGKMTTESDVYSLAMIIVGVCLRSRA